MIEPVSKWFQQLKFLKSDIQKIVEIKFRSYIL